MQGAQPRTQQPDDHDGNRQGEECRLESERVDERPASMNPTGPAAYAIEVMTPHHSPLNCGEPGTASPSCRSVRSARKPSRRWSPHRGLPAAGQVGDHQDGGTEGENRRQDGRALVRHPESTVQLSAPISPPMDSAISTQPSSAGSLRSVKYLGNSTLSMGR